MELIYSMRRKPLKCEPPHFERVSDHEVVRPICTISTCNIIAFSSPTELDDGEGDTWGGHVYVCDMDTPWDSHKVTSTAYPISALEWDIEGKQLLIATTVGEVSVYTQKDYLLNEWTSIYTANFPGEHIIRATFFHNGRRLIMMDKKPDAPITDRIQMLRSAPTLKGFGGVACEGACVVTATGLIGVLTPPAEGSRAHVATDCLRPTRDHITAASITHKNGSLVIAAICRSGGSTGRWCVRCVCAVVTSSSPAPTIALSPLPTIYLPPQDSQPVSITWCQREDTESLLIAGATLTMWKCSERAHHVHKLLAKGPLQGSTTPGGGPKPGTDCFNTLVWQKTAAWGVEGGEGAACAASSRLALGALGAPHAVLATPRALHLLARDTHHYVCSRALVGGGAGALEAAASPPKKHKYGANTNSGAGAGCAIVSCVEMSPLGGAVLAIDTHAQLHLYKLPQPWADIPTPIAVQHATGVLEFALVVGLDCLDVLLACSAAKHNMLELLYDRLTESFQRQPAAFQQYYFHSWLKLRIALCRLIPTAQSSASWLTCLQSLRASWAALSLALRPDDKPEAAPLSALLDDHTHTHEHDKTLLALEAKPEVVAEAVTLQPLRLPLQRALDIGLTALLSLAYQHQHQHQLHPHHYELWADGAAVAVLRKLAGVARAAGRPADALLRLLARLASAAAPKQELIEECAALSTAWSGARVWDALPRCSLSAPHARPWPLYLEYGVEPEALRYNPEPPPYAQCETTPSINMDAIRFMWLGGGWRPARWRQCARCGSRALAAARPARHPLQAAYDARFLAACRCGGKWTLFSNI